MQIHQIRHFLAVCEGGSISRAAELCNVSQPSITRSIKTLEVGLGGALFIRTVDGSTLTDFGVQLKPHFEAADISVRSIRELAQNASERRAQTLRFGITCTLGPAPIKKFLQKLNETSRVGDVRIIDAPAIAIAEKILNGDLDAGFVALPTYPNSLTAYPLYTERYVISFCKGHRFEEMSTVPMSELIAEAYVSRLNCELRDGIEKFAPGAPNLNLNIVYESTQEQWVQNMVAAGTGIAIHPETMPVVEGILQRPLVDPDLSREISLIMRSDLSDTLQMRRLNVLARQSLGELRVCGRR